MESLPLHFHQNSKFTCGIQKAKKTSKITNLILRQKAFLFSLLLAHMQKTIRNGENIKNPTGSRVFYNSMYMGEPQQCRNELGFEPALAGGCFALLFKLPTFLRCRLAIRIKTEAPAYLVLAQNGKYPTYTIGLNVSMGLL